MNVIKLSLPMEQHALLRASEMLKNLSEDLNPVFTKEEVDESTSYIVDPTPPKKEIADPKAIFGQPEVVTSHRIPDDEEQPKVSSGVETDSDGLPWDERIHASSRGKMKSDGTWKRKRGVGDSVYEGIVLELKAAMSAEVGQPYVAPTLEPEDIEPPTLEPEDIEPPTTAILDFPSFVQACTTAQIPQDQILAALNKHGLPALVMLATRPDLIPAVAAELF